MSSGLGEQASELLEEIAGHAASAGALRILLRLAEDSPLYEPARQAGYAPLVVEHLYRLRGGAANASTRTPDPGALGLRPRADSDANGLFRLHCAITPLEVRSQAGMTAAEWADGLEGGAGRVAEHVLERDGNLHAWLRVGRANDGRWLSLCARDTVAGEVPSLVEWAVRSGRDGGAPIASLVPEYDATLASSLEESGFVHERTFEVMAHTLAIPVREHVGAIAAPG